VRTDPDRGGPKGGVPRRGAQALLVAALLSAAAVAPCAGATAQSAGEGADWSGWHANSDVTDLASVQRGARNFGAVCLGCHSLKYQRWSRLGQDLNIPAPLLQKYLLPPGDKTTDYILTTLPAPDAQVWFGKIPPDLSLMVRARGRDYIYQFLKTFYVDPTRPTGANNLRLPATAMPDVLSDLEGLKRAVFRPAAGGGAAAAAGQAPPLEHFEQIAPGQMSAAEYDAFVRDTVNFLDYVSEPTQTARRALGVWVVLFLLVFTWLAWLVKRDYWKDVH